MRPTRIAVMVFAIGAIAGCNKQTIPYLGHWDGGFEVTSSTTAVPSDRLRMNGYLQLYRTNDKFLMQLSNPTQVLSVGGTWHMIAPKRIELTFSSFRLDEPDLDKLRGMRRPYLAPVDLKSAYGKQMIFDLGADGKLTGLLMRVGPLLGKHIFHKGG